MRTVVALDGSIMLPFVQDVPAATGDLRATDARGLLQEACPPRRGSGMARWDPLTMACSKGSVYLRDVSYTAHSSYKGG